MCSRDGNVVFADVSNLGRRHHIQGLHLNGLEKKFVIDTVLELVSDYDYN